MASETSSTGTTDEKKKTPPIAMVVPVRSNRGNITIPYLDRVDGESRIMGELVLFAGPNLVPEEKWAKARTQPGVRTLLTERIKSMRAEEFSKTMAHLVGRTIVEEGKPVPAAAPLAAMDETQAIELVADVADQTLLTSLLKGESRGNVRKAIASRIETIRNPEKAVSDPGAASTKAQIQME